MEVSFLFQEVERRLNLANRLAACLPDPRQPGKITHSLEDILRFRLLAIVAGSSSEFPTMSN